MDLEEYYTTLYNHKKLNLDLKEQHRAVQRLISQLTIDYISKPFSEIWTELFNDIPLRHNRVVLSTTSPLTSSTNQQYKLVVGHTIGYLSYGNTNATYYDTYTRFDNETYYKNNNSLHTLIDILHTHGTELGKYVSPFALKQKRFMALVESLKRHHIHKLIHNPLGITPAHVKMDIPLPPKFIYYFLENIAHDPPVIQRYPLNHLTLTLQNKECEIYAVRQDVSPHKYLFNRYGATLPDVYQVYPYLSPILLDLKSKLVKDNALHKQKILSKFQEVRQDLDKYLLINSF